MSFFTDRDDLPNVYESQKEAQLKKTKEGKAHWEPDLASNSEADVWKHPPYPTTES